MTTSQEAVDALYRAVQRRLDREADPEWLRLCRAAEDEAVRSPDFWAARNARTFYVEQRMPPINRQTHRVIVKLTYVEHENGRRTPYRWRGYCLCGWVCDSWQWVAVDRPGGALPMALEHVGLKPERLLGLERLAAV